MARCPVSVEEREFNRMVGDQIRQARERANLSQGQLAAGLGISSALLCYIETGARRCAPLYLVKIALLLTVPVSSLLRKFTRSEF